MRGHSVVVKMRNKIIPIILSILLISLVQADIIGVTNIDKTIDLTKTQKTNLESRGLSNWDVTDIEDDSGGVIRYLRIEECYEHPEEWEEIEIIKGEAIVTLMTGTTEICNYVLNTWQYFEDGDLTKMDAWEESRMKGIAEVDIERKTRTYDKIREGLTNVR